MKPIFLITDYLGRFGTKYGAVPYRSGMDRELLSSLFRSRGLDPHFLKASQVQDMMPAVAGCLFLYTSSEDRGGAYKSYIEDVVLALSSMGAIVIPPYPFLRAHENKVLAELMRRSWGPALGDTLTSHAYGSYEEMTGDIHSFTFPVVVKRPAGSRSKAVWLASSPAALRRIARRISRVTRVAADMKDRLRRLRHRGYRPESTHRAAFIVQQFVPGLANDWKVLVLGNSYYALARRNRKNDFRASGSGSFSFTGSLPAGLLDFAAAAYSHFGVPFLSLDIACSEGTFHLLEVQFIYFGTYIIEHSPFYFVPSPHGGWETVHEVQTVEKAFVDGVVTWMENNNIPA